MSLDVYLHGEQVLKIEGSGIFIREDGQTKQISRDEWDRRWPDREPAVADLDALDPDLLYTANITHNLNSMAKEAGIYTALWRPEEMMLTRARQLVPILEFGIEKLGADPDRFRLLNSPNGWGKYENLLAFAEQYLLACQAYPSATISVWR